MTNKFARKGHLVVDVATAKLAKVGDTDAASKKILSKSNIKLAEDSQVKTETKEKPVTTPKAKAVKETKVKAVKAPKEKAADTRKIKLLVKENPKREGTKAHTKYELYRTSKTVAEFISGGGSLSALKYDADKQFIELA